MYDALYEVIDGLEVMNELNNNLEKNREIDSKINIKLEKNCINQTPKLEIESNKNCSEQKILKTIKKNRRERKNKSDIDKKKKLTGKPWYYIGEISNGYRAIIIYVFN